MYMVVLRDPVNKLLNYVSNQPVTTPLCGMHSDGELMLLAKRITTIIHEMYPTESDQVGMYCDSEHFSFEGKNTLTTQKYLKETKEKIKAVLRKAGADLHYEHRHYDDMIRNAVDLPFSANWFEVSEKFYEDGPPMIHMPVHIMGHVLNSSTVELEPEHEEVFSLRIEDQFMN